jgi:hypothetical protein
MRTEINDHVTLRNGGGKVIATINLRNNLQFAKIFRARNKRLSHPAF